MTEVTNVNCSVYNQNQRRHHLVTSCNYIGTIVPIPQALVIRSLLFYLFLIVATLFLFNRLFIVLSGVSAWAPLFALTGCEIRLRNLRIASRFWKTANQNYHFSRKLIIFSWLLNFWIFGEILNCFTCFAPCLIVPTNYIFQKGRLLKRNCLHKVKQKAFFNINVNVERSPRNI